MVSLACTIQFWRDQQKSVHQKVHPGAVLRPSFWALFSISIGVSGFQSKQFPLRNQIWETPIISFIQGKMHDIKMHTKAKGREPEDQWDAVLYRVFGEMRATAWRRDMLQQWARSAPVALWCGDLIRQARQGSLVSKSLESNQIPTPVEGAVLILSGDDTLSKLELWICFFIANKQWTDCCWAPRYLWDWLSVK